MRSSPIGQTGCLSPPAIGRTASVNQRLASGLGLFVFVRDSGHQTIAWWPSGVVDVTCTGNLERFDARAWVVEPVGTPGVVRTSVPLRMENTEISRFA